MSIPTHPASLPVPVGALFPREMTRAARLRGVVALSGGLLLGACQAPHSFPEPDASWKTHTGQLKYRRAERVLVGEVIVSRKGSDHFQLEFLKGGGVPLIKVRTDATTGRAEGLLAGGTWQGSTAHAPKRIQSWMALPQAFAAADSTRANSIPVGLSYRPDFSAGRLNGLRVDDAPSDAHFDFRFSR